MKNVMISVSDVTKGREVGMVGHNKRDSGVGSVLRFLL